MIFPITSRVTVAVQLPLPEKGQASRLHTNPRTGSTPGAHTLSLPTSPPEPSGSSAATELLPLELGSLTFAEQGLGEVGEDVSRSDTTFTELPSSTEL